MWNLLDWGDPVLILSSLWGGVVSGKLMSASEIVRAPDTRWALVIGALAAASPHTSGSRLIPSLVGGVLVAIGVVFVRRRLRARAAGRAPIPLQLGVPLAGWLCAAFGVLLTLPTLEWLWSEYTISIWRNGHGLFLPLIIFTMARSELRHAGIDCHPSPGWALLFLFPGVLLSWIDASARTGYVGALGLMLLVPGLCLLVLGLPATRRIAYPLSLLVFLLPIAEGWTDALALASTSSLLAERIVDLLGMDVFRHQTLFALSGSTFGVSLNCSGLSTLYSALLLVLIVGWRAGAGAWRMIALLTLATWPLTVVLNSLRVAFILGGTQFWGIPWMHSPIHGISGIAVFWAVMAIVAGTRWWLDGRHPEAALA